MYAKTNAFTRERESSPFRHLLKFIFVFISFAFFFFRFPSSALAATTYDMATINNWNIRIDGASAYDNLGSDANYLVDVDNNGKPDLIAYASNIYRNGGGSTYIIYDSILSNYVGIGKTIDLSNPLNYNVRFDGPGTSNYIPGFVSVSDLNSDGKMDLLIGTPGTSYSGSRFGSVYVIYNSLLNSYSGVGNNIDLSSLSNFNIRFDGGGKGLGDEQILVADVFNTGKKDLVLGADFATYNARGNAGYVYVIKNSIFSGNSGTGNIINLTSAVNYSIRYGGTTGSRITTFNGAQIADINNNGLPDLFISSQASNNSRATSGSLYIIYDSLLGTYKDTLGNDVDLANSSSYSGRIDGASARTCSVGSGDSFSWAGYTDRYPLKCTKFL